MSVVLLERAAIPAAPAARGRDSGTSIPARAPVSGPVLFARYAFGPNRLGLCGPEDWLALLQTGADGTDDPGLRHLASRFEGAYPYLQLLAESAGIFDPLDPRVVEAYWLGTELAASVSPQTLKRSLDERFRRRVSADSWRWLSEKPAQGALPVHAFHVLNVFPRLGLLRGGNVSDALGLIDACRIRWGRVLEVDEGRLVVAASRFQMVDGRLEIGQPALESIQRWLDGTGFLDDVQPDDVISIHWDWACDRLNGHQLRALSASTQHQLAIANRTI